MSDHPHRPDLPPPPGSSFINRIVAVSLEQKLLVALLTLILIGVGLRALNRLPVDAYPDLSPPMVEIDQDSLYESNMRAPALPTFHAGQLMLSTLGFPSLGRTSSHWFYLAGFTLIVLGVASVVFHRREQNS